MPLILEGVRVLEVAEYGMVPSAASVLGEWGADVIKVEHAFRGDPLRGLTSFGVPPGTDGFIPMWEPFNRSKRSIGIDIAVPEGRRIILDLGARADVFITSFLPAARKRLGIEVDDLRAANPNIIYARGSAHGQRGAEADTGGFDGLTYWHRCGIGSALSQGKGELVHQPGPGVGDIQTGMTLAGGVAAALYHRERTGEPLEVDTSLLAQGCWTMSGSLVTANLGGFEELPKGDRLEADNPLTNAYRTSDGRWIMLGMIQADRYWIDFCGLIGEPDLAADPRFSDMEVRRQNRGECIKKLDAVFQSRTLVEWRELLSRQDGPFAIVQRVGDLNRDDQAWANGYFQAVDYGGGRKLTLSTAPLQFNGETPVLQRAPEFAEHTEEVLLELGYTWDDIERVRESRAIA